MFEILAGNIMSLWGWKRNGLAFFAGAILTLALPPFDFFAVGFISFPILIWLLEGAVPSPNARGALRLYPAAVIGWFFGFGYFVFGLWWLANALLAQGNEFIWALPLAVFGLPAFLALFYAGAAMIGKSIWGNGIGAAAALAFGFGLCEWFRATIFTGFPWNGIGLTAMPSPVLMQSASIFGVTGINALAVLMFALPSTVGLHRHRLFGPLLAICLLVSHGGYGYWRIYQAAAIQAETTGKRVRLVQPSYKQSEKWDEAERDKIFANYLSLSTQIPEANGRKPDLIIWPETAVPFIFMDRPQALSALGAALNDNQTLLAGAVRQEGQRDAGETVRYYNSMLAINGKGEIIDAADKVHLVPFGEYLPFSDLLRSLGVQEVAMPGGFSAGSAGHILKLPNLPKILPLICYEIIFPGVTAEENGEAKIVVNITNDAWYGRSPGPYQHFRLAQLRSVESGIPLIRSANNGISGEVDGYGRVVAALALDVVGVIDVPIATALESTTYIRHGQRVIFLLFATLFAISSLTKLRSRSRMNKSV